MKQRLGKKGRKTGTTVQDFKQRRPEPPSKGECPGCGTVFPSKYARKNHRCSKLK